MTPAEHHAAAERLLDPADMAGLTAQGVIGQSLRAIGHLLAAHTTPDKEQRQ